MRSLTDLIARRTPSDPDGDDTVEDEAIEDGAVGDEAIGDEAVGDEAAEEDAATLPEKAVEAVIDADAPDDDEKDETAPASPEPASPGAGPAGAGRSRRLLVVLAALTVLFGGSAAWFGSQADRVRDESGARNGALTDVAGTSDVKGVVTDAVNTIFSFDYADMGRTEQAADHLLTGGAVRQYDALVGQVRAQASRQKLVLTTTVTDGAVEMLQGNRARLLLFADQRSTRTATPATNQATTYAAAMLAVDAVRQGGHWKISAIDTLGG
jgi:Mce-associated membrane protein